MIDKLIKFDRDTMISLGDRIEMEDEDGTLEIYECVGINPLVLQARDE